MFDKAVLLQLVDYINLDNILCTNQSAYRPHHGIRHYIYEQ